MQLTHDHEQIRDTLKRYIDEHINPHVDEWEAAGQLPRDLHRKAAAAGVLGLNYPEEFGGTGSAFDLFHSLVQTEELARPGAGGICESPSAKRTRSSGRPSASAAICVIDV